MPNKENIPSGTRSKNPSGNAGAYLIALAGLGVVLYGVFFLIWNFTGFIEFGLTAELVGGTPEQIQAFSPRLFHYISHLHINFSAVVIALGLAMIALAWFGIRRGERWALWAAVVPPVIALVIGLPVHYGYGLATAGHLGPVYLILLVLVIGTVLSYRALRR
jgi:hypothetical protein